MVLNGNFLKQKQKKPNKNLIRIKVGVHNRLMDIRSSIYLAKWRAKKPNKKRIKVGFIVQMPEIWNKQESVYIAMCNSSLFDTWLIIVPAYDFEHEVVGEYGLEKDFFKQRLLNGNLLLAYQNNKWIDLKPHEFDYIFYQRPYDQYLPEILKSDYVVKHSRICYIPYATSEMKDSCIYPRSFFRNVYLGFMEDKSIADNINKRFAKGKRKKFYDVGYPAFEKCINLNNRSKYKRVLWTPRWTYESSIGGSHFFEYNHSLTVFPWNNSVLIVRPHPLMWSEFLKKEIITIEEKQRVFEEWDEHGIIIDDNRDIEETFKDVDILISDRSSVIPLFFLTGKPIIYCKSGVEYSSLFSKIVPGLYIVNNWDELEETLKELLNKRDSKELTRKEIIKNCFQQHKNATESIISIIYDDAKENVLSKEVNKCQNKK